jgi:hypothetical protein
MVEMETARQDTSFELKRTPVGLPPRASVDGEVLDWFDDARGYAAQLDAPEFVPAGSTLGRNPCAPARGRRVSREVTRAQCAIGEEQPWQATSVTGS